MTRATSRITCNLQPGAYAIARRLASGDKSMSEYLLRLIREDAERQGVEWTDDERNQWGDVMRIGRMREILEK